MVDLLRTTGAAVRGLALPASMDNALRLTDSIRAGCIYGSISRDVKLPHVATRDVGAAAANLLPDRSWIGQKDVPVLGPRSISPALSAKRPDIDAAISRFHLTNGKRGLLVSDGPSPSPRLTS